VDDGLPFFGMPLAVGHGLLGILLVLRHIRARAVFAHAKAAVPAVRAVFVERWAKIILGSPAGIPAGINVPAEQVGNFIHLWILVHARRGNRRARGIFAVGDDFQILQLAVRIGHVAVADFVEQAPDKNGGVVDVLPDEIEQLVARRFFEFRRAN
jgi:hypothetical protein